MSNKTDLDYIIKPLFKKAEEIGFTECEFFSSNTSNFRVTIRQGEIEAYENSLSQGFSFRGMHDGKFGSAYSENMDIDSIDEIIDVLINEARENAVVTEEVPDAGLFAGSSSYPEYSPKIPKLLSADEKIVFAKKMEEVALSLDERVVAVDHCVVVNAHSTTVLVNSLGLNLSQTDSLAAAYLMPRVTENNQTKTGFQVYKGIDFEGFDPTKIATEAVDDAISMLGAKSVASSKYKVIIENKTFGNLLSSYVSIFFAKNVQKGFSLLQGKLNTKIASDLVTIRDDGIYEGSLSNSIFDGEGVATTNKVVVENGVLKTYLYNLDTAAKDKVASTGNASRGSYKSTVNTTCNNFYIVPTENASDNLDGLCKNMENGLIINDLSGLHAGVNQISGDFSLLAAGFLVENGVKTKPVEQITISGNILSLFNNVIGVGSDLYFKLPSGGSIGSPSIFVSELDVSGEL